MSADGVHATTLEQAVEVLAEGGLQVRQVQEEILLFDAHELVALVETGTRHQTVDMRMELQFLRPASVIVVESRVRRA